jgi:hypothetical protein
MVGMLGHVGVLVPGGVVGVVGVVHLHEAHAGLAQPAGKEALAAEVIGRAAVDSVQGKRLGCLAGEVEDAWRRRLHPRRKLTGSDHRFEFGVAGTGLGLGRIDPGEQITAGRCQQPTTRRREITDPAFARRHTGTPDGRALVDRREEGGPVIARSAVAEARGEADKAGEIVVLGAETVIEPGPE